MSPAREVTDSGKPIAVVRALASEALAIIAEGMSVRPGCPKCEGPGDKNIESCAREDKEQNSDKDALPQSMPSPNGFELSSGRRGRRPPDTR